MGLITKAVKKVEKKENPPVEPGAPPKPEAKKGLTKKKVVIAVAALLFIGTSLGLGYFFLLKPAPEVPQKVARRSIGARKKPPQAEQRKDSEGEKAKGKEEMTASAKASDKIIAGQGPNKETGVVSAQKVKTSAAEGEPSAQTAEIQTYKAKEEPETPKSTIEVPQESFGPSPPEMDKEIQADAIPSEGEKKDSEEDITDEAMLPESEEMPSEEMRSGYLTEQKEEWTQTALEVTERSNSRAERYYKKGVQNHQRGEFNKAIDFYRKALNFNPDHRQADMNLATAYLQVGRFKEAEQILVYLYALRPKDLKMLFNFGWLLYKTGEHTSAETKLARLLELNPFHLEANLLLASIFEERGEFNKAIEPCMKAYRINSADPRVLYRLGRLYDMMGESTKAAKYYRLFLNSGLEKENELELAVRDRLNYLISKGEKK